MVEMVQGFFFGATATALTLIPKVSKPRVLTDF